MGIRESHPKVYDDGLAVGENDRTTVTCDRCPTEGTPPPNGKPRKLKPNKLVFEFAGMEAVLTRLAAAGRIAKTGYVPAGSVNPKTGGVYYKGHHTAHVCVCPKCQGRK